MDVDVVDTNEVFRKTVVLSDPPELGAFMSVFVFSIFNVVVVEADDTQDITVTPRKSKGAFLFLSVFFNILDLVDLFDSEAHVRVHS